MNRRTRALAGLMTMATAATLTVAPASAAAPEHAPGGAGGHQVTLLTGDRVRATQRADGRWRLTVDPVRGGTPFAFQQFPVTRHGRTDWYLVPDRATRLVAEGLLDRELFNITGLIRQGYDDARSDTVPLLVQYPEGGLTGRSRELPGTTAQRELPGLGLAAVAEKKASATDFWRELTHQGPAALSGGARKIWLNGKVSASLDQSVPQVGAPAAWQAGFTGKGVTVAVLDTGVDDTHPDLAGKVKHSKDFSGKGNVKDGNGHGTHVAATTVGTGAADGGKLKGVAPEADLAIGKVLGDDSRGTFDAVLAGMEWAAAEVKAKVINMSLGGGPTDGDDPLSQAVNTLSRKHNALFVISAGNSGSSGSIGSPGAADLALTVGSVTKSGSRSEFSSQGPRAGNGAVKPEISAPGSDIVAARATGTTMGEPVNDRYTKASGTSMAAPHVTGGAAILAQQHPGWTAEQLKSALVSTSVPVSGNGVFAVGGGRMDLAKAVAAKVLASPSAVNAFLKWPSTTTQTRTVTYTNPGSTPLTLNLKLDLADTAGAPAPAALAKLSANTLTIPAGGQAAVTITLTPRTANQGSYGGVLTATDGTTTVRSLVGAHEEGEHYDVSTKVLRQDGAPATPADGQIFLVRQQDGLNLSIAPGTGARVPPGTYSVMGWVHTPRPGAEPSVATFANPEVKITKATALNFDARQAKQVKISTDQPAARGGTVLAQMRLRIKDTGEHFSAGVQADPRFAHVSSYSTPGISSPAFGYANTAQLTEPGLELFTEGAQRSELDARWAFGSPQEPLEVKLASVHAGSGTAADLAKVDAKGKFVVISMPNGTSYQEALQRVANVKAAGGKAAAIALDDGASLRGRAAAADQDELPALVLYGSHGPKLVQHAKTGAAVSLTWRLSSKHRYELAFPATGKVPAKLDHQVRTADLAAVTNAYYGYGATEPPSVEATVDTPVGRIGAEWSSAAVASAERVEHFTPGDWELAVRSYRAESGHLLGRLRLEAGKSYRQEWNKAVNGPGFVGTTSNELGKDHPWAWAKNDKIDVIVPWWSDAAGHPREAGPGWSLDKGTTTLYDGNGQEIGRHNAPGRGVFARGVSQGYRLVADVTRDAPWWRTSTKISATWTFPQPNAATAPLSLLSVRYAPPVDLRNLAPGDRDFAIPVTVPRQDGPGEATSLAVDYSTDEGATWQQAKVDKTGAGWTVTVRNPAKGFVSLRAKAVDGSRTVEQTVLKAYEIG
ncbi:S8 family serine peptidase [Crossiella sp. CA-258035]|uniref:S8 family serine peptidase n=1 Tax=Crossiella sp. CA-258035 TaxID=2981138 RepID=UPI0024BCBFA6|nr:S8 family serine peptidase [Crossiella sp. CA-258035]WHT21302.1 S8 family serine peptidase [Crossiella sp. CA-258035]